MQLQMNIIMKNLSTSICGYEYIKVIQSASFFNEMNQLMVGPPFWTRKFFPLIFNYVHKYTISYHQPIISNLTESLWNSLTWAIL